jgi:hypothetical protein
MPAQEVTGTVDGSGLVDVLSNEVVVSGSSSRNQFRIRLGGRSVHTLNGAAIRFALLCGHEVPASVKHWYVEISSGDNLPVSPDRRIKNVAVSSPLKRTICLRLFEYRQCLILKVLKKITGLQRSGLHQAGQSQDSGWKTAETHLMSEVEQGK